MREESVIRTCPICSKVIALDGKKVGKIGGIEIVTGYSIGGWGSRQDFITFSGEVCQECFDEYVEYAKGIKRWFQERRDKNKPEIIVNNMSNMQDDKLQPKRRGVSLLRLLS